MKRLSGLYFIRDDNLTIAQLFQYDPYNATDQYMLPPAK